MGSPFPAGGHRYLVDFKAFKVELFFASETSLTWTQINKDGSRGDSETETIRVTPIKDELFLVTWQESDNEAVVHLEDYKNNTIITNITDPNTQSIQIFHGTMTLIS